MPTTDRPHRACAHLGCMIYHVSISELRQFYPQDALI